VPHVLQSGKNLDGQLVEAQADYNLCLLKVPGLQSASFALTTTKKLSIGERVYAIGVRREKEHKGRKDQEGGTKAKEGKEERAKLALEMATVTSLRSYNGAKYLRISPPVSSSFSGGGLFDKEGNLLGILSPQIIQGEELTFVLPVEWIDDSGKDSGREKGQRSTAANGRNGLNWLNRALALKKRQIGAAC
jgi:S1-C subfamily serine protease